MVFGDVFSFMELVLFPENKNLSVIPNMSFFYNCRQIAYLSKAFPVFFFTFSFTYLCYRFIKFIGVRSLITTNVFMT